MFAIWRLHAVRSASAERKRRGKHLLDVVPVSLMFEDALVDIPTRLVKAHLLDDFLLRAHVLGEILENNVGLLLLEMLLEECALPEKFLGWHPLVVLPPRHTSHQRPTQALKPTHRGRSRASEKLPVKLPYHRVQGAAAMSTRCAGERGGATP